MHVYTTCIISGGAGPGHQKDSLMIFIIIIIIIIAVNDIHTVVNDILIAY